MIINPSSGKTHMPQYIKCTAIPASLLEHEEFIKRAVGIARNELGESMAIVDQIDTMFAELHEALDGLVMLPSELMGMPQDLSKIVSIQVQTTRLTGAGVEMVSFKEQHNKPTHWSIYKRDAAGMAHWIEDIDLKGGQSDVAYGQVMGKAAKYSIAYQAFIEQPF